MKTDIKNYLNSYSDATTLAFFRLAFGLMMAGSLIRFISYGWIEKLYIKPQFHFTYYGFEWVQPIGNYTYLIFAIALLTSIFVAIGFRYRLAAISFFVSFTYIELMDKTTYLNHYYFITIISFILIFLPANATFSVDACKNKSLAFSKIPKWNTDILKLILAIVYIYAGIAKLNSDWLLEAMPLKIWLPAKSGLPVLGSLLSENWVHYAFSWVGMIYDLGIVFLLLNKRTRIFAFALVVIFHVLTKILFPIGVFPYVMIISSLIFFDHGFHKKILVFVSNFLKLDYSIFENGKTKIQNFTSVYKLKLAGIACFIAFQLLFPFRYLCYPNELFWTEEGFRFSWRVMLMEKAGYTQFYVVDKVSSQRINVDNSQFLTSFQEKQMAFQPDFMLEYAHFIHDYFKNNGMQNPEVYLESYVALNGRLSQRYIDPKINLAKETESFAHKTWLLPFNDEIKGF